MKKAVLILVVGLAATTLAAAQQLAMSEVDSPHYKVYSSVSANDAQSIANEMEAYFKLFNSYFHFDASTLPSKLRVRIYGDKSQYDDYLSKIIAGQRNSFVFLQYSDSQRSVLVGYHMNNENSFQTDLVHHGFVQFLKSFISEPPLWLQEGFAVYFENSRYDSSTGVAHFRPNLGWLPTLKQGIQMYVANDMSRIIPPAELLTIDAETANKNIDAFYAESWGFVSFLLNSDKKVYNRMLWDAIDALSRNATASENETAIENDAISWVTPSDLELAFKDYIDSLMNFPELVQSGMKAYAAGKLKTAEVDFKKAVALNDNHYVPYYYLGLVAYADKDYYLAEQYFQTALQMGGDPGLVNYALGINAYADNRLSDAKKFLSQAVSVESAYKDKATSLLARINEQSSQ